MKNKNKSLKILENIIKEGGYRLRYEKGHFQAGYCTLENEKIVLVNKFLDASARYECLLNLLETLNIERSKLSTNNRLVLDQLIFKLSTDNANLFNLQKS